MEKKKEKNVHEKHRERQLSKYKSNGAESFCTHELLEALLYFSLRRINTNTIAHGVLDSYSGTGLLRAGTEELINVYGIGERSALLMKLSTDFSVRLLTDEMGSEPLSNDFKRRMYVYLLMRNMPASAVVAVFLTKTGKVQTHSVLSKNKYVRAEKYLEMILSTAKAEGSAAVILCHDHADNSVEPSIEDKILTEIIRLGLEKEGITLTAHYIVTDTDCILCGIQTNEQKKGPGAE